MYYFNSCKLRMLIIIIIKWYGTRFFFDYIVIIICMKKKRKSRHRKIINCRTTATRSLSLSRESSDEYNKPRNNKILYYIIVGIAAVKIDFIFNFIYNNSHYSINDYYYIILLIKILKFFSCGVTPHGCV